jgi:hypothetical protein
MRALPTRYVPPSGFGYPLDGFLPSIPCRFCFAPAALMGFSLRSFLLPKGIRYVSARKDPPTVGLSVYPMRGIGPARQAPVSGLCPFQESLATRVCLARQPLAAPLGFALLGLAAEGLEPGFRPTSPRVLGVSACTSEYRSAFALPRPILTASRKGDTRQPF